MKPMTFKEFASNPITALLFLCLMVVGYLYFDGKSAEREAQRILEDRVAILETKVSTLEKEKQALIDKLLETIESIKE